MSITTSEARNKFNDLQKTSDDELWEAVRAIRDDLPGRTRSWIEVTVISPAQ